MGYFGEEGNLEDSSLVKGDKLKWLYINNFLETLSHLNVMSHNNSSAEHKDPHLDYQGTVRAHSLGSSDGIVNESSSCHDKWLDSERSR